MARFIVPKTLVVRFCVSRGQFEARTCARPTLQSGEPSVPNITNDEDNTDIPHLSFSIDLIIN